MKAIVAITLTLVLSGCYWPGEMYTAGVLVVEVREAGSNPTPIDGLTVLVAEGLYVDGDTLWARYVTSPSGRVVHRWGWMGGGHEYTAHIAIMDSAYVPVDTTQTFPVRGAHEDNRLFWRIDLEASHQR